MRWIGLFLILGLFAGITSGALLAATRGWGLPGLMDKPVSIRQSSVSGRHRSGYGPAFIYWGARRRHYGGGFRGGK